MMAEEMRKELQSFWEVPAIAHFCSLFREVFKLIDFEIEELEEALIADSVSLRDDDRSSLIIDILITLMNGIRSKKDVTLLNYNNILHRVFNANWVCAGIGPNPLGTNAEKASFHVLPLYAKVKILHVLCEWRLARPDVEPMIRNFSGESLRVLPLGQDHNGITYWYFYGTRLYSEDPEIKLKISLSGRRKIKQESFDGLEPGAHEEAVLRTKKKRRHKRSGKPYEFGAKRRRNTATRHLAVETEEMKSDEESSTWKVRSKLRPELVVSNSGPSTPQSCVAEQEQEPERDPEQEPEPEPEAEQESEQEPGREPETETDAEAEQERELEQEGADDSKPVPDQDDSSFAEMLKCMYRARDDEDSLMSLEDAVDGLPRNRSFIKLERDSSNERLQLSPLTNSPNSASLSENTRPYRTRRSLQKALKLEAAMPSPGRKPLSALIKDGCSSEESATTTDQMETVADKSGWDQELLRPPVKSRWHMCCSKMDDWKRLVDVFSRSSVSAERRLHKLLVNDFLPALEDMFIQTEKEAAAKAQELTKRVSDRLEVKKLKRKQEMAELARREAEERRQQAMWREQQRKQEEIERREVRHQMREMEKERQFKLKQHAAEERLRRLELRQKRQEMYESERKSLSPSDEILDDRELNELDIQLELEHMYGQMEKLLNYVKTDADSWPFCEPVTEDIAPDYHDVIKHPMDFQTVQTKIDSRDYRNKMEFIDDINLIFLNCLQYNGLKSDYTKHAQRLERVFLKGWKRYFPPSETADSNERVQHELMECLSKLGALDRKIKWELQVLRPKPKPNIDVPASSPRAPVPRATAPKPVAPAMVPAQATGTTPAPVRNTVTLPRTVFPTGPSHFAVDNKQLLHVVRLAPGGVVGAGGPGVSVRNPDALSQPTKPMVYVIPKPDGNRLLRLITPNGSDVPPQLAKQLIPLLRKHADKLPKGLVTVTASPAVPNMAAADAKNQPSTALHTAGVQPSVAAAPLPTATLQTSPVRNDVKRPEFQQCAAGVRKPFSSPQTAWSQASPSNSVPGCENVGIGDGSGVNDSSLSCSSSENKRTFLPPQSSNETTAAGRNSSEVTTDVVTTAKPQSSGGCPVSTAVVVDKMVDDSAVVSSTTSSIFYRPVCSVAPLQQPQEPPPNSFGPATNSCSTAGQSALPSGPGQPSTYISMKAAVLADGQQKLANAVPMCLPVANVAPTSVSFPWAASNQMSAAAVPSCSSSVIAPKGQYLIIPVGQVASPQIVVNAGAVENSYYLLNSKALPLVPETITAATSSTSASASLSTTVQTQTAASLAIVQNLPQAGATSATVVGGHPNAAPATAVTPFSTVPVLSGNN